MVYQSATVSCMTDLPVSSIEWRNQSSQLSVTTSDDTPHLTVLEYTIPLVTLDLQEQTFTCVVMAGDATYMKTVYIPLPISPPTSETTAEKKELVYEIIPGQKK